MVKQVDTPHLRSGSPVNQCGSELSKSRIYNFPFRETPCFSGIIHFNKKPRRRGKHGDTEDTARPWAIVYTEEFPTNAEAANREPEIKNKKSRKYIGSIVDKIEKPSASLNQIEN